MSHEYAIDGRRTGSLPAANPRRLPQAYWWVVMIGAVFTLARFSEALLILRAQQVGLAIADAIKHSTLLMLGLAVLMAADLVRAYNSHAAWVWAGISLRGLHMGMTQGLLAAMAAQATPREMKERPSACFM